MTERQAAERQRACELWEKRIRLLQEAGRPLDATTIPLALDEVAQALCKPPPRLAALDEDARSRAEFERLHRGQWGDPLDALRVLCVWAEELLADLAEDDVRRAATGIDLLLGLHASACSTASAAWWLLSGGYSVAAEGATRTLFELAVVTRLVSRHLDNDELIDRFNADGIFAQYRYVGHRHEAYVALGVAPPEPSEVRKLRAAKRELRERYDDDFKQTFWWARHVLDDLSLPGVAKQMDLGKYVPFYSLANNSAHAGRAHLSGRRIEEGSESFWLSGASIQGVGRPGAVCASLIGDITVDVTAWGTEASDRRGLPYSIVGRAIKKHADNVVEAFIAADPEFADP